MQHYLLHHCHLFSYQVLPILVHQPTFQIYDNKINAMTPSLTWMIIMYLGVHFPVVLSPPALLLCTNDKKLQISALYAIAYLCKMVYEAWSIELCDRFKSVWTPLGTEKSEPRQNMSQFSFIIHDAFLTCAQPKMGQSLMEGQSSLILSLLGMSTCIY